MIVKLLARTTGYVNNICSGLPVDSWVLAEMNITDRYINYWLCCNACKKVHVVNRTTYRKSVSSSLLLVEEVKQGEVISRYDVNISIASLCGLRYHGKYCSKFIQ